MAGIHSSDSDTIQVAKHDKDENRDPLEGLDGFTSRRRSLDIEIVNETESLLRFVGEEFRRGEWFVSPDPVNIDPGKSCLAFVCSKATSLLGVKGGLVYELVGKGKYLYIGFDNPLIGPMKTFIEMSNAVKSAKWACNQLQSASVKNISYDGFDIMAVIKPPRQSPFRLIQYTVKAK